ncbi:hypothetical protein LCGC14_2430530 [marine sediment metagenome]|uniref:Uncharacterized protein n=1 Tax=marine sediment metagenome TaxID=412755 RepID=A0A0F9DZ44_9ZZZZ|nr:hypothetical protein [Chlamydiota bacterium]
MAIIPFAFAQVVAQQVPVLSDTRPKMQNFGAKDNEWRSSIDPAKDFTNYLGRVHKKYKNMDTANIENLVNRLLQEQDQTFMNFVREETTLRDTWINRFFEAKTPLGDVLQELKNSQESPNRKLLSKEIFIKAEKEAGNLIEIEEVLAKLAGNQDLALVSITSLNSGKFLVAWESKDQNGKVLYGQLFNADGTKSNSEFQVNTYTKNTQAKTSVESLSDGGFEVTYDRNDQEGIYGQLFNADGTKRGPEFQITDTTDTTESSARGRVFDMFSRISAVFKGFLEKR